MRSIFKKVSLKNAVFLFFVSSILLSCSNKSNEDETTIDADTTNNKEVLSSAISNALPSPLQIALIFKKSGLKFDETLTNPESNIDKYNSRASKMLNLGVYGADLSYCVLNKNKQASINYLKNVKQLLNEIGLSSVFQSEGLGSRFEKNIDNQDSLAELLSELQMETDFYLSDSRQQQSSTIIFAGAWVETMFIATSSYHTVKNPKLGLKLSEQFGILENILKALNANEKRDGRIDKTVSDLQSLKNLFESFESVKNFHRHPSGSDSNLCLNENEILEIGNKITEVRIRIINP